MVEVGRNIQISTKDTQFLELCLACRTGDVENADRLITSDVNPNRVDEFDNSPLFLASLCGHEEVVKLLLKRGAICDRDRHEGARCIYGALTDSIRNILLKFDISKAVDLKQPFATHLSSLIADGSASTFDFEFRFDNGESLMAHKFMLVARSQYFRRKFDGSWSSISYKKMPPGSDIDVFSAVLKFIYLVPVLHELKAHKLRYFSLLVKKLGFSDLLHFLDLSMHVTDPSDKANLMNEFQYKFNSVARDELKDFVHQRVITNCTLLQDNDIKVTRQKMQGMSSFADVLVRVSTDEGKNYLYMCHKAILIRCNFFRLMFTSSFSEGSTEIPVVSLPTSNTSVAEVILRYLYYDSTDIPWEIAIDVLSISDFILIDRLKVMAAVTITQNTEFLASYSIFDVLSIAWSCSVERLEHYSAKVIAEKLEEYVSDPLLKDAIVESSQRIKLRQDTDTIELIDDIRFYLLDKHNLQADILELLDADVDGNFLQESGLLGYRKDLELLDNLLIELGFDV